MHGCSPDEGAIAVCMEYDCSPRVPEEKGEEAMDLMATVVPKTQ